MDRVEEDKRVARTLETQLYAKLGAFSKLALAAPPPNGDETLTAKWQADLTSATTTEAEIVILLDKVCLWHAFCMSIRAALMAECVCVYVCVCCRVQLTACTESLAQSHSTSGSAPMGSESTAYTLQRYRTILQDYTHEFKHSRVQHKHRIHCYHRHHVHAYCIRGMRCCQLNGIWCEWHSRGVD
jgi:hypothetical protein